MQKQLRNLLEKKNFLGFVFKKLLRRKFVLTILDVILAMLFSMLLVKKIAINPEKRTRIDMTSYQPIPIRNDARINPVRAHTSLAEISRFLISLTLDRATTQLW